MSKEVTERLIALFLTGIAVWMLVSLFAWLIFTSIKSYQSIQDSREYHEAKMKLLNTQLKASESEKERNEQLLKELKALE